MVQQLSDVRSEAASLWFSQLLSRPCDSYHHILTGNAQPRRERLIEGTSRFSFRCPHRLQAHAYTPTRVREETVVLKMLHSLGAGGKSLPL